MGRFLDFARNDGVMRVGLAGDQFGTVCYTIVMQKIATRVFIWASVVFGVLGIVMVLTAPNRDSDSSNFNIVVMRLLMATVFIILPSFALSVAGRYLNGKSK